MSLSKLVTLGLLGSLIGCTFSNKIVDYDNTEWSLWSTRVAHIASAVHKCTLKYPSKEDAQALGARQEIVIDLSLLKTLDQDLKASATSSGVRIRSKYGTYYLELKWVGKNCTIRNDGQKVILSFVNAWHSSQSGYYLYSIYDPNDYVWRAYLFDSYNYSSDKVPWEATEISPARDQYNLSKDKRTWSAKPQ